MFGVAWPERRAWDWPGQQRAPKSTLIKENILKICNLFSLTLLAFTSGVRLLPLLFFAEFAGISPSHHIALPPCSFRLFYLTRFCYFLTFKSKILRLVVSLFPNNIQHFSCVVSSDVVLILVPNIYVGQQRRRGETSSELGSEKKQEKRFFRYFVRLTKWCSWDMMETSRKCRCEEEFSLFLFVREKKHTDRARRGGEVERI